SSCPFYNIRRQLFLCTFGSTGFFRLVSQTLAKRMHSKKEGSSMPKPAIDYDIFRLLVQEVKDYAIFMLDPRGKILSWNAGAQRLKGYTADEIIGKHFSIFYGKDDLANRKPQRELETAAMEGRVEDEGWRLRKD